MIQAGILAVLLSGCVLFLAVAWRVVATHSVSTSGPCEDCEQNRNELVNVKTRMQALEVAQGTLGDQVTNHLRSVTQRLRRAGQLNNDDEEVSGREAAIAAIAAAANGGGEEEPAQRMTPLERRKLRHMRG